MNRNHLELFLIGSLALVIVISTIFMMLKSAQKTTVMVSPTGSTGMILPATPEVYLLTSASTRIALIDTASECVIFFDGNLKLCRDGRFYRGSVQLGDDVAIAEAVNNWARAFNARWRDEP